MNKADINNEIVLMRKTVRQAKIHIIRKLVREIKKLKGQNVPEAKAKKFNDKMQRLCEELTIIKKLNCDDISKYSLTTASETQQILSHTNISIKDRALSRIAAHKLVKDKVINMKTKYNISDNIEKIVEPGKKKLRKLKNIEGKAKKKEMKQKNRTAEEISAKREEWLKQNNSNADNNDNVIAEDTIEKQDMNNEKDKNADSKSKFKKIDENVKLCKSNKQAGPINLKLDSESSVNDNTLFKKHRSEIKVGGCELEDEGSEMEDRENEMEHSLSIEGSVLEDSESEIEEDGSEMEDVDNKSGKELKMAGESKVTTVDDFFITDGGAHYKSTYVPKMNVEVKIHNDGLNRQQRRAQMFGKVNKKPKKIKDSNAYASRFDKTKSNFSKEIGQMEKYNQSPAKVSNSKVNNKLVKPIENSKDTTQENTEKVLHPSWEAKKKQKVQIAAFQGKKIVFDD